MEDQTISKLHDFTLKARGLLEKEIGEQLEGIYGWLPNGVLEAPEKYPAIKELEEAGDTRNLIEQYVLENQNGQTKPAEVRQEFLREVAFTWLNRLVAFKMMETRKLLRQVVSKGTQSQGFIRWLTEPGNETYMAAYEQGDLPQNRLGEGPRQEAYRRFILFQCGELAREIRVLFDPEALASSFFPRPAVLTKLSHWMNEPSLEPAWAPGNEDTIGWVYQYFSEEEKKDVFDRLYKKKQKIIKEDIPAATQLFTPNWIVKWLVQNTLGRHWVQMHPDSVLAESMEYLVPLAGEIPAVQLKKAKDIKLMDPACGTMHFGLEAFDLFASMYREEMERAGSEGWPAEASVSSLDEIPAVIISRNLHGLDIDLRSVQLSALALFLKAKAFNRDSVISESRIGCASLIQFSKGKLDSLLKGLGLKYSIYGAILSGLWPHLQSLETGGSLVRLEQCFSHVIEEEKKKLKGQLPMIAGFPTSQFDTDEGVREFWGIIESQIIQALHLFAKQEAEQGRNSALFAREVTRGFQVLDLMMDRYDVVVTNPPYMTRRNMHPDLAAYLQKEYPNGKGDLYAAFIERCSQLLQHGGCMGMITQQSFMFISSYEKLRSHLTDCSAIETMCHVGPRAFDAISGGKVNTTLFALRKEHDAAIRYQSIGTYFRIVKEPNGEGKRRRFEAALASLKRGEEDPAVFRYRQGDFDAIPGGPWVYWITSGLRRPFVELKNLGTIAKPKHGMSTGNNFRFLRFWWEVGIHSICFDCLHPNKAREILKKWFPYMKGGGFKRWFGNQSFVLNYLEKGSELLAAKEDGTTPGHRHDNPEFYFRRGVTWTDLTSGRFSARLSPGGFIFDVKGSSAFPDDIPLVLGLLNSSFAHYILSLLNPTVSFQVGDISRLPVPSKSSKILNDRVEHAISSAKSESAVDETTYDFITAPPWTTGIQDAARRSDLLDSIERQIDEEVYRLYGINGEDRQAIEKELASISLATDDEGLEEVEPASQEDAEDYQTSNASALAPPMTREDLARKWISYGFGIIMGRFEPGVENGLGRGHFSPDVALKLRSLADPDGIMVMDEGHPDDLPAHLLEALKIMLGEKKTSDVIHSATGKDGDPEELLRHYLERTFFKLHIQQYRKRPVYWFLQSPKKKYGIWVFHERLDNDSLFRIQKEYAEPKVNYLEAQLVDLRKIRDQRKGREQRDIEKAMAGLSDIIDDVRDFVKILKMIIEERGYRPHIDDGVLLNIAPLWELLPSWQAEPKKAWQALEHGEYDWSYQAMDHWPDRVKEKCKTNRSYAIAHGLA